jgi:ammonia channel protein AmtB
VKGVKEQYWFDSKIMAFEYHGMLGAYGILDNTIFNPGNSSSLIARYIRTSDILKLLTHELRL